MAPLQALLLSTATVFSVVSAQPRFDFVRNNQVENSLRARAPNSSAIPIKATPAGAAGPVLDSFVTFSIELAFFPDFAGNKSHPNTFSDNLLNNLKDLQGTKPYIRVGGNTQDYALYDANLTTATRGVYIPSISLDYPRQLWIGPSFFESYNTWPGTKFIHGFNLAINGSTAITSTESIVPLACKALSNDNFLYWEMGNEPDLFKTSAQGIMRPKSWNEKDFAREWTGWVERVKKVVWEKCGEEWQDEEKFKWIAPSFAGTTNSLDAVKSWQAGLNKSKDIALFSSHNYIGGATQPGVTLANTLLNHTKTMLSVRDHTKEQKALKSVGMNLPYILGETNSLYNQGKPGLSNSFGAALWGLDFNLYCAATDIKRVHMHMGSNFRYASWQPVETNRTTMGTKAPYYGNIAVAASLGGSAEGDVRVQHVSLEKVTEAAYAVYKGEVLRRVVVVNMVQYNTSSTNPSTSTSTTATRGEETYTFSLPPSCAGRGVVQRLMANGSDAVTGITFNGYSYNYELDNGKPVLLGNVTRDEAVPVKRDGELEVRVPWSSAAVVQLEC
ncbi:hypothetical protein GQ43DRAFT_441953 [Delitschia confertaspora ATCC 74209]|uniref:Beta-glucuronidase C-terminal domain-containing protein n=1 Tax=Delitschia confertaspora ATCC 74209 TaxID=1513339 RepID=A0A9P4JII9_9PLEO|nr:hypothetical protein GQ43DRAFT_441953 [Delitschia confertaspora ATCC 74209]